MSLVEIRPLPLKKFHGKVDKEAFAQPKAVEALYNEVTGQYDTGLTEEEIKKYEPILGVKLDSNFRPDEPHPTWGTKAFWIGLPNQTLIFNTEKPHDYIKIKLCKASKFVANTYSAWENGEYAEATHYIYDEEEQVLSKATKVEKKQEANSIVVKMSNEDKASVVQILSKKSVKNRSAQFINVEIDSIIEDDPVAFLKLVKLGKEEVAIRANIYEMEAKGILTKEAGCYYYMGDMLAYDFDQMVEWMRSTENQRLKVVLLNKLNNNN